MNAKKLSLILCILLIALCISSCNNTAGQTKAQFTNPIDFGKKYKSRSNCRDAIASLF